MIVPFAAGGPTDAMARHLVERMRRSLRQTIVVENITGADGSVGAGRVARAKPDGNTIVIGNMGSHD
jgi:tripartite-type tricarboxylate transporter receptor subunit TctC